jgi:glycosyltransferase involved in cell wall biosynthesis
MTAPLVSVLMTAYNREQFIAEAIESVLAQTFVDFELIVVDDKSSDRSAEIAHRYTSDPRVRVFVNERNLGQFQNRNRAAELARGKYLKYADSDDMLYPHCLEVMTYQMELFRRAGLGLACQLMPEWAYPAVLSPSDAYRLNFLGRGGLDQGPTATIIRKDVFRQVGGFPVTHVTSDTEFILAVARRHPVLFTIGGLIYYRYHAGQQEGGAVLGRARQKPALLAGAFQIQKEALLHPDCPLSEPERALALRNLFGRNLRMIIRKMLRGRFSIASDLWILSGHTIRDLRSIFARRRLPYADNVDSFQVETVSPNWKCYPRSNRPSSSGSFLG